MSLKIIGFRESNIYVWYINARVYGDVHMCMYVCMYVCMHVWLVYVCMQMFVYVCNVASVILHVYMYV